MMDYLMGLNYCNQAAANKQLGWRETLTSLVLSLRMRSLEQTGILLFSFLCFVTVGGTTLHRPDPPFSLNLQLVDGTLRVSLVSRSPYPEIYLHHGLIQPTVLVILDATGKAVIPSDARSHKLFNPKPERDDFAILPPGETRVLHVDAPEKLPNGTLVIHWGQLTYNALKPGRYEIHAEWECKHPKPYAPDEGERHEPDWLGKLRSESVTLILG